MNSIADLKQTLDQKVAPIPSDRSKSAAVLLLLIDKPEPELIFTQRSSFVHNHKHQVSFPGGAVEPEDVDLFHTAMRETCEEIHVCPDMIRYLGSLPIFTTHYGLDIYPFVASIQPQAIKDMEANDEVETIFTVTLTWLQSKRNWYLQDYQSPDGRVQKVIFYQSYQGFQIWGITAAILHEFLNLS
ncbi:MAG: CoA pyrophosphatase [Chloroflexi bacterium]|jgi:8-oxo-dGTP pyrophosphatase MutT (NUDIX family)|nr:CoA pyrophosphatase [Chloroflexota bacterium]